ncbi:LigB family dioxygenase [Pluralibacter gergoviae]|nr:LigB family dioxygenase [Pluralibacter gergoviae]
MSSSRMPALFIGHGSPMNVLEDNVYTRAWRHLGDTLPRPKAIVVVSAHWFTRGTGVTAMETPKTIHDFGGFSAGAVRYALSGARLSGAGPAAGRTAGPGARRAG